MNKIIGVVSGLALILSIIGLVGGNQSANFGVGTRFQNGISADNTSPVAGEVRGTTFTSTGDVVLGGGNGALTLTTSNTATSTATIGCVQTYATSTATAVRLTFGITPHATSTSQGTNSNGLVAWQYGSCPI